MKIFDDISEGYVEWVQEGSVLGLLGVLGRRGVLPGEGCPM